MKPDYASSQSAAKAAQFRQKMRLDTLVVKAKLGFFFGKLVFTLSLVFVCILAARDAKFEGDLLFLTLSRIGLLAVLFFLVGQLAAIIRLIKLGGACVIDSRSFRHFSVGKLPWSAIHSAMVTEADVTQGRSWWPDSGWGSVRPKVWYWDDDDDVQRIQFFIVLTLDRRAFRAIRPSLISRLILRRYARFDVENSVVKIACDSLDEGPEHLLWSIQQRIEDKQSSHGS
jgi:hypothetical protein